MRKVALIIAAALTLAVLSRLPAVPLDAGWRTPAGPVAAASINPLELMRQATDLPVQGIEDFSMIY
jgi:hypothetical protein